MSTTTRDMTNKSSCQSRGGCCVGAFIKCEHGEVVYWVYACVHVCIMRNAGRSNKQLVSILVGCNHIRVTFFFTAEGLWNM